MLNSSTRSSIAALTTAVQAMPYAPSVENETNQGDFGHSSSPAVKIHAEIQKRDATQENAGWITLDEIKQNTGLTQSDLVSGLRQLLVHQAIETVMGNGQGNHRYRMIKSASVDFLAIPASQSVNALRKAVAEETKVQINTAEPILLAAAKENVEGDGEVLTAPIQKRDARGHFLPMPGKKTRHRKSKKKNSLPAEDVVSMQRDAQESKTQRDLPVLNANSVERVQESHGELVVTFERRPGGPSVLVTLEDAIALGQEAVKVLQRRASMHH